MGIKLDYKRLIVFACIILTVILLVRGCLFSCAKKQHETAPTPRPMGISKTTLLRVYDDDARTVFTSSIEDYIVGVVAAEMPSSFELEALKAQAVAARTFTARLINGFDARGCSRDYDICTDSRCCQAWNSQQAMKSKWGTKYDGNFKKIQRAVSETAGEILLYDGSPIEALYHSTSGGATEDSEHVFASSRAYLKSVESPGEEAATRFEGQVKITISNLVKKLNASKSAAKVTADSAKKDIAVISRYKSGRVEAVRVGKTTFTGKEFRKALDLNSANFTIKFDGDSAYISTRGFGHGVGMSQYGANAMAKDGARYRDILEHYYTGVTFGSIN